MKIELLKKDTIYKLKEFKDYELDLISDIEFEEIFNKASNNDKYLKNVFSHVLMDMLIDINDIKYREDILLDLINNEVKVDELYQFISSVCDDINKKYLCGIIERSPLSILSTSVDLLHMLIKKLDSLKEIINGFNVKSEGMLNLIDDINNTFTKRNLERAYNVLPFLESEKGMMISVSLNGVIQNNDYTFNKSSLLDKDFKKKWKKASKIYIQYMTEPYVNELNRLLDKGVFSIYESVGIATNNIIEYFNSFRLELGFYKAAINLLNEIKKINGYYVMPIISLDTNHKYNELYDLALSLKKNKMAVGNTHDASNKNLFVITGANQGGKSTYLRSIAQAQIMMQAGIFVCAKEYSSNIVNGLYTHFDREEDSSMQSGKLDEELKRLSNMIDSINKNSMILFNESFQSTNEHEGSNIGLSIINALLDEGLKVFLVTHMFDLSNELLEKYKDSSLFLRALRDDEGNRSYKLAIKEPLQTSFAMDLYNKIFD